ncbi:hypothetical protein [Streptomyces sp. NPDC088752]|uniref:hypothetical protein n=1 Tax=Streptomyces sp. NPDC088752 TaxID=3154963 RepID=UPI00342CEF91
MINIKRIRTRKPLTRNRALIRLSVLAATHLALLLVLFVRFAQLRNTADALAIAWGAIWGMLYLLGVVSLALILGSLRRILKPRPLKVDPANPPVPGVYISTSLTDPPHLCYCHGYTLCDSQPVIMWPQPPLYTCDNERGAL